MVGAEQPGEDPVPIPLPQGGGIEVGIDDGGAAVDQPGVDQVIEGGHRKAGGKLRPQVVDNQ